ncbi:hypothetical protein GWK47_012013 [Chionoecetes opilio]|uniref:Uncharacterized protein n=1 Tax=Chionoecetes opilio TaxID=41210 RepID=A0A8J5CM23_CHIOP|nr:hypothetical protein GWK47_012013 [Chionoecetes opilio]
MLEEAIGQQGVMDSPLIMRSLQSFVSCLPEQKPQSTELLHSIRGGPNRWHFPQNAKGFRKSLHIARAPSRVKQSLMAGHPPTSQSHDFLAPSYWNEDPNVDRPVEPRDAWMIFEVVKGHEVWVVPYIHLDLPVFPPWAPVSLMTPVA